MKGHSTGVEGDARDLAKSVHQLEAELELMRRSLDDVSGSLARAIGSQIDLRATIAQGLVAAVPPCSAPITQHRREHRAGRAPKIESGPQTARLHPRAHRPAGLPPNRR